MSGPRRLATADLVLVAAAVGLVASGFAASFRVEDLAPSVALPLVGAALVAATTARARSTSIALVAQLVAAIAVFLVGIGRGADQGPWTALAEGLTEGWSRLWSSTVPAPADPTVLAVPFVVVWLAVALGAELAARVRTPLAPAATVPLVVVAVELAAPVDQSPYGDLSSLLLPGVLSILVLLGAVRAWRLERVRADRQLEPDDRRRALRGRALQVLPVLLAVVVIGGLAGPRLPVLTDREPYRPREGREDAPEPDRFVNPVDRLAAAYVDDPDTEVVEPDEEVARLRLDEIPPPGLDVAGDPVLRVPLVTFDRYDGATWSTTGPFRTTGEALPVPPAEPPEPEGAVEVPHTVEVLEELGPWLPALDRPIEVRGPEELRVDPATGSVVGAGPLAAGTSYEVVSLVPQPPGLDDPSLASGIPPGDVDYLTPVLAEGDATRLQGRVDRLAQVARRVAGTSAGVTDQAQQLRRLQQLLTDPGSLPPQAAGAREDPREWRFENVRPAEGAEDLGPREGGGREQIPTGHSLERINQFLYTPVEEGGDPSEKAGRGTPEQFATTYVLLARSLGFPSRLVVGWTIDAPDARGQTVTLRRRDADAWAEVWISGRGWVAVDPTPEPTVVTEGIDAPTTTASTTTSTTVPGDAEAAAPSVAPVPPTAVPGQEVAAEGGTASLLAAVAAALVVATLAVLALLVRRRRARRRAGTPVERLGGAWDEAVDALRRSGAVVDPSWPASRVAAGGAAAAGTAAPDLVRLAQLVTAAVCGPGEPGDPEADEAWRCADAVRHGCARASGLRGRLRLALSPSVTHHRDDGIGSARGADDAEDGAAAEERSPEPVG